MILALRVADHNGDGISTYDSAARFAGNYTGVFTPAYSSIGAGAIAVALRSSGPAIVYIQGASACTPYHFGPPWKTTESCAFTSPNTAGNAIVVDLLMPVDNFGDPAAVVTDTQGNTYHLICRQESPIFTFVWTATYIAWNIAAGANTVTVNTANCAALSMAVHEYSGTSPSAILISIASPGVVSWPAHGLVANDSVVFLTTGALPTGLTAGTGYFVKTVLDLDTFTVSGTSGGAVINTTGSQSGAHHTVTFSQFTVGTFTWGACSTALNAISGDRLHLFAAIDNYGGPIGAVTGTGPVDCPDCPVPDLPDVQGWLVIREPEILTSPPIPSAFTDRTPYLYLGDAQGNSFSAKLRQRGQASVHLEIDPDNTYTPTRGAPLYLFDQTSAGYSVVFAGLIQDVENQWIGKRGHHFIIITAVSLESVFDTVYAPPHQYVNWTCGRIVIDLLCRLECGCPVSPGDDIFDGATIPLYNTNYEKISDIFSTLATSSGFTWGVDPVTQTLFFRSPTVTPAPWVMTDAEVLWESLNWKQSNVDYRNRQAIRIGQDAFSHSREFFIGSDQKEFTLMRPVEQVTQVYITLSTPNTAVGTFSGNPAPGDTITVGPAAGTWIAHHIYGVGGTIVDPAGFIQVITSVVGGQRSGTVMPSWTEVLGGTTADFEVTWTCKGSAGLSTGIDTYTFVDEIDNREYGQVLRGPTAAVSCQHLFDAINANDAVRGTTFSLPTRENSQCNAVSLDLATPKFTLQQKSAGSGWISDISAVSTAFSWSGNTTSGGSSPQGSVGPNQGATITIGVGVRGTAIAGPALVYTPGSASVSLVTPLNSGTNMNVEYTRYGGDVIEVEDTDQVEAMAALTHGTGKYQQITDASSTGLTATTFGTGLAYAQQALAAYSVAPKEISVSTYRTGIFPGTTLTLNLLTPTGAASLLNGDWIVEEVTAELIPARPYMRHPGSALWGHFKYTFHLVNKQEIGSYLDFWEGLGGGSSAAGGGAGTGSALVATSGGGMTGGPALQAAQTVAVDLEGAPVGTEPALNLIAGAHIALTVVDNPGSSRVDATIALSGGIAFNESIFVNEIAVSDDYFVTVNASKPILVNGA